VSTSSAHAGARFVAWSGFALGSLVSIAGNWLAAWLATPENPDPKPAIATQLGAAVWPVMLLIAIEVLSRTPWRNTLGWQLVRFGGVGVVAAGSAVISYGHIHEVLMSWGYDWIGAGVGPLVVDGLMTISGFALLAISQQSATSAGTVTAEQDGPASQDGRPGEERPAKVKRGRPAKVDRVPMATPSQDVTTVVPTPAASREERPVPAVVVPAAASRPDEHPVSMAVPSSREAGTQDADREAPAVPQERPAAQPLPPASRDGASWEEMAETLKTRGGTIAPEEAWAVIRAYRDADQDGKLPTANLLKTRLGLGHSRASRLLQDVDSPDAARPDLHTVAS
jgi:hypothetical protein